MRVKLLLRATSNHTSPVKTFFGALIVSALVSGSEGM